jgi:ABC-type transport system substrate-binding protein
MDDSFWPYDDLNQLYAPQIAPFPNWLQDDVYQPLINVNGTAQSQGNIMYLPGLAINWTTSADAETYTFNLRQGVTFSDGNAFNAYQVWMNMLAAYYTTGNSSTFLILYNVFNMSNVKFGAATIALINQSGLINPSAQAMSIMMNSSWPIYVTSPYQIVFHLKSPFIYFVGLFAAYLGLQFDAQYVLDHGGFGAFGAINSQFNQHPIPGTGPYMVTSMAENAYVQFSQNPTYWGKNLTAAQIAVNPTLDPGHVKNVIINYKPDDLARYTDLNTGAAQIVEVLKSNWNLVLSNPDKFSYFVTPPYAALMSGVGFNTQLYPTNNTWFRQALVHAINYTDICVKAFLGECSPVVGPEYPVFKQFYNLNNATPYSYNLTLAKQDLNKSGITNPPTLTFRIEAGLPYHADVAAVVQGDLSALGINVNIVVQTNAQYYSAFGSLSYETQNAASIGHITMMATDVWIPNSLDPVESWNILMSNSSPFNVAVYTNPVVQKCTDGFTSSNNITYLQSICKQAETQIYNDAPYAWFNTFNLWQRDGSLVWQKSVIKGFLVDPLDGGQNTMPLFNTVTFVGS